MYSRSTMVLALALGLAGCVDRAPTRPGWTDGPIADLGPGGGRRHLVVFTGERVPADLAARVSAQGGAVELVLDAIGVAAVAGLSDVAAATLASDRDVLAVEVDDFVSMSEGAIHEGELDWQEPSLAASDATATTAAAASPTTALFYSRQWNMPAIHAPVAWAAGHRGSGSAVVAIIDTGIDYLNPDLAGRVDIGRSTSFVPEDDPVIADRFPGRLPISDLHFHGTAVASVVATNGLLLAGVNQRVTFIAVKAFDQAFRGTLDRTMAAIVYAADQGADVINISVAFSLDKKARPGTLAAFQRAVNYAFRKGALLITAAGNDAADLQHDGNTVRLPCEAANAICVSATGPTGAAGLNGPWTDVDAPAPYTAFGRSAISVAAPGGAGEVGSGRRMWVICSGTTIANVAAACRAGQPIAQPAATSFAAPHVAGLAALLVDQLGKGRPDRIRARILQSADDLGAPGLDPLYGHGRINVARALGLVP